MRNPTPGQPLQSDAIHRAEEATVFTERQTREAVNVTPTAGMDRGAASDVPVWAVRVTGSQDSPSGLYPGVLMYPVPDPNPGVVLTAGWADLDIDVWVLPFPDQAFEVGDSGLARLAGVRGNKAVYTFATNNTPFLAHLTTTSGGNWNFQPLKLSGGIYVNDGSATTGYPAIPLNTPGYLIVTGLEVWVLPSKQVGKYEFIPTGYADSSHPGLVSTGTQTFAGHKTVAGAFTATGAADLQDSLTVNANVILGGTLSVTAGSGGGLVGVFQGASDAGFVSAEMHFGSTGGFGFGRITYDVTTGDLVLTSSPGIVRVTGGLSAGSVTSSGGISGTWSGSTIDVAHGGTGDTSLTAYAVLCGGTTSTGAVQSVSGLGSAGEVLTSNGAGTLPTWQAGGGGSSYFADEVTLHLAGTTFSIKSTYVGQSSITTVGTLTGGATGAGFTVALGTSTVTGTLLVANGGTGRTSDTAYAVICGGTTTTAAQQSVSGLGTSGQVLTSNGAGALPTWQAAGGGGSPGGSDTYIQFNSSGSFGGSSHLTWADGARILTVDGDGTASAYAVQMIATGTNLKAEFISGSTNLIAAHFEDGTNTVELCRGASGPVAASFTDGSRTVKICDGVNSVTYAASTPGNWAASSPPTDVWVAIDRLAAALTLAGFPP